MRGDTAAEDCSAQWVFVQNTAGYRNRGVGLLKPNFPILCRHFLTYVALIVIQPRILRCNKGLSHTQDVAVSHTVAICMLHGSLDEAIEATGDAHFESDCHIAPDICINAFIGGFSN